MFQRRGFTELRSRIRSVLQNYKILPYDSVRHFFYLRKRYLLPDELTVPNVNYLPHSFWSAHHKHSHHGIKQPQQNINGQHNNSCGNFWYRALP